MASITLDIGGRAYSVACRDGGEDHLRCIAAIVDAKVQDARAAAGSTSEVRQLLFAALLLADELHESNETAVSTASPDVTPSPDVAPALAALALRIEAVADALERQPFDA